MAVLFINCTRIRRPWYFKKLFSINQKNNERDGTDVLNLVHVPDHVPVPVLRRRFKIYTVPPMPWFHRAPRSPKFSYMYYSVVHVEYGRTTCKFKFSRSSWPTRACSKASKIRFFKTWYEYQVVPNLTSSYF
eukprot:SAG31_NODE_18491_length_634_cov_0.945794_1_plen_131_part_01